jgi:hypothetical protein
MPTFYDPDADAGEASEALRGLAHASRGFESLQDMYGVLGDLLSGMRSLHQVVEQLAAAHKVNRPRAFDDDGDHAIGTRAALAAAEALRQAANLIDQAEDRMDAAMTAAGRIAWRSLPDQRPAAEQRWVSVCFLQGEDADEVLKLIDDESVDAALGYLKNWDYGGETTQAALENGHVYAAPPTGPLEQGVRDGNYDMTYSHSFGHFGRDRLHEINPADALADEELGNAHARKLQPASPSSRFEHPGVAAVKRARGLGL